MTDIAPTRIVLSDDFDIFGIAKRWEDLMTNLRKADGDVELDLSRVGDLDVSGMQLLLAVKTTLASRGSVATFVGLKPEVLQRMAELGLHLSDKEPRP